MYKDDIKNKESELKYENSTKTNEFYEEEKLQRLQQQKKMREQRLKTQEKITQEKVVTKKKNKQKKEYLITKSSSLTRYSNTIHSNSSNKSYNQHQETLQQSLQVDYKKKINSKYSSFNKTTINRLNQTEKKETNGNSEQCLGSNQRGQPRVSSIALGSIKKHLNEALNQRQLFTNTPIKYENVEKTTKENNRNENQSRQFRKKKLDKSPSNQKIDQLENNFKKLNVLDSKSDDSDQSIRQIISNSSEKSSFKNSKKLNENLTLDSKKEKKNTSENDEINEYSIQRKKNYKAKKNNQNLDGNYFYSSLNEKATSLCSDLSCNRSKKEIILSEQSYSQYSNSKIKFFSSEGEFNEQTPKRLSVHYDQQVYCQQRHSNQSDNNSLYQQPMYYQNEKYRKQMISYQGDKRGPIYPQYRIQSNYDSTLNKMNDLYQGETSRGMPPYEVYQDDINCGMPPYEVYRGEINRGVSPYEAHQTDNSFQKEESRNQNEEFLKAKTTQTITFFSSDEIEFGDSEAFGWVDKVFIENIDDEPNEDYSIEMLDDEVGSEMEYIQEMLKLITVETKRLLLEHAQTKFPFRKES